MINIDEITREAYAAWAKEDETLQPWEEMEEISKGYFRACAASIVDFRANNIPYGLRDAFDHHVIAVLDGRGD